MPVSGHVPPGSGVCCVGADNQAPEPAKTNRHLSTTKIKPGHLSFRITGDCRPIKHQQRFPIEKTEENFRQVLLGLFFQTHCIFCRCRKSKTSLSCEVSGQLTANFRQPGYSAAAPDKRSSSAASRRISRFKSKFFCRSPKSKSGQSRAASSASSFPGCAGLWLSVPF